MKNKMRGTTFLEGKSCLLRPIEKRDINGRYLSWINDRDVTRYMETGIFPSTLRDLRNFYKSICGSQANIMFAILDKKTGRHIGNIKLGNINWVHRFADLGIMIGDKRYWGKGYGREACRLVLDYAFARLNLNKIILGLYANHASALKTYKNAGFKVEGRIKKLLNFDGKYIDKVVMGISRSEAMKR